MRDQSKPDYRPAWLKACDSLTKNVVAVVPEPVVYTKHPVGPHPVRMRRGWRKPAVRRELTPRALARANPSPNPMPRFVREVMADTRRRGPSTPNADARRSRTSTA